MLAAQEAAAQLGPGEGARPKRQRKGHAGQEAAQGHAGHVTQAWTA